MGTEQKKRCRCGGTVDRGCTCSRGCWLPALVQLLQPQLLHIHAWRLSPPTGACRQAVRRDNHLPQQLLTYAWQCCISTKPCALSRLTLRWVSPDFRTFPRTSPHDDLFITSPVSDSFLASFHFPSLSLFQHILLKNIFFYLLITYFIVYL